jgi:hypothetical protein
MDGGGPVELNAHAAVAAVTPAHGLLACSLISTQSTCTEEVLRVSGAVKKKVGEQEQCAWCVVSVNLSMAWKQPFTGIKRGQAERERSVRAQPSPEHVRLRPLPSR